MCVESALLGQIEQNGGVVVPETFGDKLAPTYVVRRLYSEFTVQKSFVELMPWNYEGGRAKSDEFRGCGKASAIVTAIKELRKIIDKAKITPAELPEILDFAFRVWYKNSAQAVNDAIRAATEKNHRSEYHFATTLGAKVIISVSLRAYAKTGKNEKLFKSYCDRILHDHFVHHKDDQYSNKKAKKMDMDQFWVDSMWFNDSKFNSGMKAATRLIKQLTVSCDDVCGPLSQKKQPKSDAA